MIGRLLIFFNDENDNKTMKIILIIKFNFLINSNLMTIINLFIKSNQAWFNSYVIFSTFKINSFSLLFCLIF
jgi:hypothetical protein